MITRNPLRQQTRSILTSRILNGTLEPGSRISEPELSGDLGISKTPIREALLQLECTGLVRSDMGKGFSVGPLSIEEYRELCPIMAGLHAQAMRLAGLPATKVCDGLRELNSKIGKHSGDGKKLLSLDRQWHDLLLQHCKNKRLLDLVAEFNVLAKRYDYAYWRGAGDICISHNQHTHIIEAVEAGDLDRAVSLLEAHWLSGLEPVVTWLESARRGQA